jgi:TetR/AcrR family transcriptional regulator, repressor for neighboring sulfatase
VGQDEPTRPRRGRPPNHTGAPHGPEQVIPAVVAAAIDQFAEGGLAGVTVRQIAAQAGVNPGLVHRYIGSKVDLVRAAVTEAGAELDRQLDQARAIDAAHDPRSEGATLGPAGQALIEEALTRYERLLAHLALEDHDLEGLDVTSELWTMTVARAGRAGLDPRAAQLRAVSLLALDLGWRVFGPVVAAATRLEPGEDAGVWAALHRARDELASRP